MKLLNDVQQKELIELLENLEGKGQHEITYWANWLKPKRIKKAKNETT